jgi:membrane protease YdiL (CAAX protease family)
MHAAPSIHAPAIAIVLIESAALFAREFARRTLLGNGSAAEFAADASYLAAAPVLLLMLWPILWQQRAHLAHIFRLEALTLRVIVCGILAGGLIRVAWWSQLVLRLSLGATRSDDPDAAVGPVIHIGCPSPAMLLFGVLVIAVLVPVIEETINRGLIFSTLIRRGTWTALLLSSLLFAAFHGPDAFLFAFAIGFAFAVQYGTTGAIWFSLLTHATYNALALLDWRCVTTQWNPPAETLPHGDIAIASALLLITAACAAGGLIAWVAARARRAPWPASIKGRSRPVR